MHKWSIPTRMWCLPCAELEWTLRETPEEDRINALLKCEVQGCKVFPSYGTTDEPRRWCRDCAVVEWARLDIPVDEQVDYNADCRLKCTDCGDATAKYGVPANRCLWCLPCAKTAWVELDTPEQDQLGRKLAKCELCKSKPALFGTGLRPRRWCSACAPLGWAAADTPETEQVRPGRRCQVCASKGASYGTLANPTAWCRGCADVRWEELGTPDDERLDASGYLAGPIATGGQSGIALAYLAWLEAAIGVHIQHAASTDALGAREGEHLLAAVPSRRFRADGFVDAAQLVIEFHGCLWHGCLVCIADRNREVYGKTPKERLAYTRQRAAAIRAAGYKLVEVWEHEFRAVQAGTQDGAAHLAHVRSLLAV